ncbi:uncharacterized protein C20orf96-like [Talpa occidentalis]|uniref:uncharacterized protein C20orf96-like n=1 Tax=Talpa occidentalis TaxID=50954 RepID=UPI00188F8715|nr:uncharacterized protein C20orf96-like [Talpa occidentalis]
MALVVQKPSHYSIRASNHKFHKDLAYVPWQRSNQKTKPSALPPVQQANGHKKGKMKSFTSIQPGLHSKPSLLRPNQKRNSRDKVDPTEMQARIRLMRV